MKYCTLIFIILFVLTSCGSWQQEQESTTHHTEEEENTIVENESLQLRNIAEILEGIWLPKEYVDELSRTKNAFTSWDLIPSIAELQFKSTESDVDTLYIGSSLGNHEGYGFNAWIHPNKEASLQTNACDWEKEKYEYELSYALKPDTTVTLNKYNMAGNLIEKTEYIRILGKKFLTDEGGTGYQYIVRRKVLSGKYRLLNQQQNEIARVSFDPVTEKFTGFDFKYYDLITDFAGGPNYRGNCVLFLLEHEAYKDAKYYALLNRADTTQLWTINIDSLSGAEVLGEFKYYLTKEME